MSTMSSQLIHQEEVITDAYVYTHEMILQNLVLLEDHFKAYPCPDCIQKHIQSLRGYLREAIDLAPQEHKEFWVNLKDEFYEWSSDPGTDDLSQWSMKIREFRKRVMHDIELQQEVFLNQEELQQILEKVKSAFSKAESIAKEWSGKVAAEVTDNIGKFISEAEKAYEAHKYGKSVNTVSKAVSYSDQAYDAGKITNEQHDKLLSILLSQMQLLTQLCMSKERLQEPHAVLEAIVNDTDDNESDNQNREELNCIPCGALAALGVAAASDKKCPSGFDATDGYCAQRVKDPGYFDPDSIRNVYPECKDWAQEHGVPLSEAEEKCPPEIKNKAHIIKVGCPKGKYDKENNRCEVGMEQQSIWHPQSEVKEEWEKHEKKLGGSEK